MVRSVHTLFPRQEDDPPFVGGNVVINNIPYLSLVEFENFAMDYHYNVRESSTFGFPQEVSVTIADMNDTALAIVRTVYLDDNDNVEQFGPQVFPHWGVQSNENVSQAPKTTVKAPFQDDLLLSIFRFLYGERGIYFRFSQHRIVAYKTRHGDLRRLSTTSVLIPPSVFDTLLK